MNHIAVIRLRFARSAIAAALDAHRNGRPFRAALFLKFARGDVAAARRALLGEPA